MQFRQCDSAAKPVTSVKNTQRIGWKMEPRAHESSSFLPLMGFGRVHVIFRPIRSHGRIIDWSVGLRRVKHRPVLEAGRPPVSKTSEIKFVYFARRQRSRRKKLKYRFARASNGDRSRPRSVAMLGIDLDIRFAITARATITAAYI